ncbi:HD domain-containing protein [Rhizobium laguerreae]|uniref:HD domain-containing protein n=1 Tax=Rhizobium laguerreae TaxID=1076926 RepID=UPI001C9226E4|nr:HD domain-containing protein [Rhizobium laguerreae]MBY3231819.1 HD domain-containing protein [Rhizobium laguerreae]
MGYSMNGENKIQMAKAFAAGAHGAIKQVRKYTGEPYIIHPAAVAAIVEAVPTHTWQMLCMAWLHDTVEDTGVTHGMILDLFGEEVRQGVWYLTNVERSAGNRAARFKLNLQRLADAPNDVKTVKLADLYDNTGSIVKHDPTFAPLYLQEKAETLEVLRGADQILWDMTYEKIGNEALSLGAAA